MTAPSIGALAALLARARLVLAETIGPHAVIVRDIDAALAEHQKPPEIWLDIWCDGSHSDHSGRSGMAWMVREGGKLLLEDAAAAADLGSAMAAELAAAIHGLRAVAAPARVRLHSDNQSIAEWAPEAARKGDAALWQDFAAAIAAHHAVILRKASRNDQNLSRVDQAARRARKEEAAAAAAAAAPVQLLPPVAAPQAEALPPAVEPEPVADGDAVAA